MITMETETFGKLLKRLIEEAHTSQRQLAKDSGVDLSYINRLANDKAGGIGRDIANALAPHLRVKPSELMAASAGEEVIIESDINQAALQELSNIKETLAEIEEQLKSSKPQSIKLPDYGFLPCGIPFDFSQAAIEMMEIPLEMAAGIDPNRLLIVHASGESLSGDGISDGDIVVVEKDAEYIPDEIYTINIPGNGCTIKHLRITNDGKAHLTSSNPNFKEMVFNAGDIQVQGGVVSSFKPPKIRRLKGMK